MEPNNFEKDFREKLNQRKIEPSEKAWDRLDAMLSVAEETKKPRKNRKWLYIAASIVGFLLVGTFFFNQKKDAIETPKTVVIEENIKKNSVAKPVLNKVESVQTETVIAEKSPTETLAKKSNKKENNFNQTPNKTIKNESNQIAESSVIIKNNQEKQSNTNPVVVTENPKKENTDQLLEAAEKTVLAQNSVKKSKVKINAADLLNQVDGELELSFREKVITKVNKNYQTVKVALANRNQQEKE
ncbi:hypothetical protein DBB36_13075 [Flavobacterium sp. WLB]|uniref:hypothetical protein n=1 Tax=unclassified Flavobacterium TaxID=196869 RepID=UPI0006ABB16D|nr:MULTISPECIES: hypothetical protein [unclassified Flavobacterium]KOP38134.1 hypothetical protein AKO67_11410 [Flavobacterium sp. VMW]OWU90299.1 hypothetical protein APR43_14595 [Flavobacterium sp. NLM]PUU69549.1 hypothetical protein DBB36_13075 [Flavobacterium sp. WLB]